MLCWTSLSHHLTTFWEALTALKWRNPILPSCRELRHLWPGPEMEKGCSFHLPSLLSCWLWGWWFVVDAETERNRLIQCCSCGLLLAGAISLCVVGVPTQALPWATLGTCRSLPRAEFPAVGAPSTWLFYHPLSCFPWHSPNSFWVEYWQVKSSPATSMVAFWPLEDPYRTAIPPGGYSLLHCLTSLCLIISILHSLTLRGTGVRSAGVS